MTSYSPEPSASNPSDFENIIDHNSISWLSKDTLKKIEVENINNETYGKVTIKGKKWNIYFELRSVNNSEFQHDWWGSKKFHCNTVNDIIIKLNNDYLITPIEEENISNLKTLIRENYNSINIISYYNTNNNSEWFAYKNITETKLSDMVNLPNFPVVIKKITPTHRSESLLFNKDQYHSYTGNNIVDLDKISVIEVVGYPITIEIIKLDSDEILSYVKDTINKLIVNYDDINNRCPVHRDGINLLEMYI